MKIAVTLLTAALSTPLLAVPVASADVDRNAEIDARAGVSGQAWATATPSGGDVRSMSTEAITDPSFDNYYSYDSRGDLTGAATDYAPNSVTMGGFVRSFEPPTSFNWRAYITGFDFEIDVNGDDVEDYDVYYANDGSNVYVDVVHTASGNTVCAGAPSASSSSSAYYAQFSPACIGNPASFRWSAFFVYSSGTSDSSTSVDAAPDDLSHVGRVTPGTGPVAPTCAAPAATSNPAVAVRREGYWYVKNALSGGNADGCFPFGDRSDQAFYGDWNGDGFKTPGVFRASTGTFFLSNAQNGDGVHAFSMGSPGDMAVVGDWNNDGVDGIGLFRPSNGTWYLSNRLSTGPAEGAVAFGSPGDIPVPGDWNMDGTTTLGVFRPSNGTWYLTNFFRSAAEGAVGFGSPGDVPVVGDWNKDGLDSLGVFRPSNGTWYLTNGHNNAVEGSFAYGAPGDRPLVRG